MSTAKSTDLIIRVVQAGGSVIVDADKTGEALIQIAAAAAESGTTVTITNAGKKAVEVLERIAVAGAGNVTFDFTK